MTSIFSMFYYFQKKYLYIRCIPYSRHSHKCIYQSLFQLFGLKMPNRIYKLPSHTVFYTHRIFIFHSNHANCFQLTINSDRKFFMRAVYIVISGRPLPLFWSPLGNSPIVFGHIGSFCKRSMFKK